MPRERRSIGRPGPVRVVRVAGRRVRRGARVAAAEHGGHRELRDDRGVGQLAQRYGGRRGTGGRRTDFAGHLSGRRRRCVPRAGRAIAVRGGPCAERAQKNRRALVHGQLPSYERRRPSTRPVSVPHSNGL